MTSQISNSVKNSINAANAELEQSWKIIFDVANVFNAKESSEFAFRRLISYNPENERIASFPSTKQAVNEITRLLNELWKQLETNSENLAIWIQIGHCYLMLGDFINAYSSYSNVLRINKNAQIDDAYFWYGVGSVFQHFRYYKIALHYLKNALQIAPQLQQRSDVKLRMALLNRSLGNFDEAVSLLESVLSSPPPNLKENDIKFQLAFTYQMAGRSDLADQVYQDLYYQHPRCSDLVQQYAWFLSLQNDQLSFEKAASIISYDASDPMLRFVTARIAMKQGEMPVAYQRYCECISYWSDSPLFWCGLGVLYFKNEQMQDAVVAFQRALYLKGELAEAWANLGLIFELQKDAQNSMKIYHAGVSKCPDSDILKDRLNALQSGRPRIADPGMVIEVNDSRFFVQVAERIASEYAATPPFIPAHQMGGNKDTEALLNDFKASYISLFP
ncbi:TPR Domain containing protein [Tritrichomonas foetus]|uniref:TPR Domain containing protein n=1 Tax=Tritrichomonas foetus TaxID=1144522 RepID=A0A1J4K6W5_9EUKA|nr:TPR Domain containing protein [Tritrichomonas foetus]|eukprot:OHT06931.1 TPR Domain containing protein [Tritrichomonas foetus]